MCRALLCLSTILALAGCRSTADKPAPATDRIVVLAKHLPVAGQPDLDADPVVVRFEKFTVTKAHFDPKNLEGGTATLELDLTSLKSGDTERDDDLKSAKFLDVAKLATITIDVAKVEKQGDRYSAVATVSCHGVTKTYPITFAVTATTADSVTIEGAKAFSRLDFAVGVDPAKDPTERVDPALIMEWTLTLHAAR
ncbi:MAG TPA: YceI family protein [Kofleriaceae bacterium]